MLLISLITGSRVAWEQRVHVVVCVESSQSLKKLWAGERKREQEGVRASYFLSVLFLHALLLLGDSIA